MRHGHSVLTLFPWPEVDFFSGHGRFVYLGRPSSILTRYASINRESRRSERFSDYREDGMTNTFVSVGDEWHGIEVLEWRKDLRNPARRVPRRLEVMDTFSSAMETIGQGWGRDSLVICDGESNPLGSGKFH
jgi:hypothetical protein